MAVRLSDEKPRLGLRQLFTEPHIAKRQQKPRLGSAHSYSRTASILGLLDRTLTHRVDLNLKAQFRNRKPTLTTRRPPPLPSWTAVRNTIPLWV